VTPEAALTLTGRADTSLPIGRTAIHLRRGRGMDKLLMAPEEAAEILSVSRTKIYELMYSGALRSVEVGGCRRIPAASLRDYVDQLLRSDVA